MSAPSEIITKVYRAYMPEMIEIVIDTYEHYRNQKLPETNAPYRVNRKRFDDSFWKEVVKEHIKHRYNPEHTISFGRRMCGGQMPWPDLICKLPGMIAIDDRWQSKLKRTSDEFNMGPFKGCSTPEKLDTAVMPWKQRNPETTQADEITTFCAELILNNWSYLLEDPQGRSLTASAFLKATERGGLEQLDKVFGNHLNELADQL
jgi:hypothetical protein